MIITRQHSVPVMLESEDEVASTIIAGRREHRVLGRDMLQHSFLLRSYILIDLRALRAGK